MARFGNYFLSMQVSPDASNVDPFGADSDAVGRYEPFEITGQKHLNPFLSY